ncbi:MAG TPA: phosphotransferase [Mycobacteriales bacterium]|nr:phosphotransferase [Mycobacteriales bacterium]
MTAIRNLLARDYGLRVDTVQPHPGGFESDCWVADETWLVKCWKSTAAPARLPLLSDLRAAGLPVPAAIPNRSGELHSTANSRPYAVFPYVAGRTAVHAADWRQTAAALRRVHGVTGIDLPAADMDEPEIDALGERLDHPWIADRQDEVAENIQRLQRAVERAGEVPNVLCHRDFGGANLIVDDHRALAVLDWDQAVLGPAEHDLWIAAEGGHIAEFLTEYGAHGLDIDQLEYALLARALRDMAARVLSGVDQPGVDTWGFDRIARLDRDLTAFRPFCR